MEKNKTEFGENWDFIGPYLHSSVLAGVCVLCPSVSGPVAEFGRASGVHQRLVSAAHHQRHSHHHRLLHQDRHRDQGDAHTHLPWSAEALAALEKCCELIGACVGAAEPVVV